MPINVGRLTLAVVCYVLTALAWPGLSAAKEEQRPNILFILIDDLGWSDLSCYGSAVNRTPHIDRLAGEGTRFTQAYAAAHICSPTRGSIMTGKFPARTHITDWIPGHKKTGKLKVPDWTQALPDEEITLGEMLQQAGYKTAWFGKWHLRGLPEAERRRLGNDARISNPQQFHGFDAGTQNWRLNSGKSQNDPKGVFELTDEVTGFIEQTDDQPWFIGLSHYSVHTPVRYNDSIQKKIEDTLPAGRKKYAGYAAMLESLDDSIGRLMAYLKSHDLERDTLVVFFSDNGGLTSETGNDPLRDGKGTLYEGGTRVPMIVRWPGRIPPGDTSDAMLCSVDFYPTFAALAGVEALEQQVDGINVLDHLIRGVPVERDTLYWHYPHYHRGMPGGSIRQGDYKLIEFFEDGTLELYNLKNDLGEKKNLVATMPEKAEELHALLRQWRKAVGAQMMTPNPDYKAVENGKKDPK